MFKTAVFGLLVFKGALLYDGYSQFAVIAKRSPLGMLLVAATTILTYRRPLSLTECCIKLFAILEQTVSLVETKLVLGMDMN
jgi:hypothetical protein